MLAPSLILSAYSCKACRGCLLVLYSDISCVVYSVPNDEKLAEDSISLINSYITAPRCLNRRSKDVNEKIMELKSQLIKSVENITTLGCYPLAEANNSSPTHECIKENFLKPSTRCLAEYSTLDSDLLEENISDFINEYQNYDAKSARGLIAVNVSDISGNPSKYPHTMLAGAFLSAASLKVVAEDVIKETISMLDNMGVEVLNVGVDGESLALATRLPNGCPGTLLSLAKFLLNKLQILSKNELIKLCAENSKIVLPGEADIIEENDGLDIEVIDDIELHLQNSIAEFTSSAKMNHFDIFTLEEVESWLSCNKEFSRERETNSRKLTKGDLKFACLKHILPKATKAWLMKNIGREGFRIFLQSQEILYVPKTVFMKSVRGFYRTITFDSAHLTNLLRESCAKNRLAKLGLKVQSLTNLSRGKDFEYLKKILSLKNQQSLEYDPMNQRCSEALFSLKTEEGLVKMKDYKGAKCCRLLRKGIIESLDTSGISAEERILNIYKLKIFLDDNINVIDRLSKPGTDSITNELWQMINVTLDSHITTYANLEHFNPRRKSTGGVEQFFSQVTLMCDGGSKLDCREIQTFFTE